MSRTLYLIGVLLFCFSTNGLSDKKTSKFSAFTYLGLGIDQNSPSDLYNEINEELFDAENSSTALIGAGIDMMLTGSDVPWDITLNAGLGYLESSNHDSGLSLVYQEYFLNVGMNLNWQHQNYVLLSALGLRTTLSKDFRIEAKTGTQDFSGVYSPIFPQGSLGVGYKFDSLMLSIMLTRANFTSLMMGVHHAI